MCASTLGRVNNVAFSAIVILGTFVAIIDVVYNACKLLAYSKPVKSTTVSLTKEEKSNCFRFTISSWVIVSTVLFSPFATSFCKFLSGIQASNETLRLDASFISADDSVAELAVSLLESGRVFSVLSVEPLFSSSLTTSCDSELLVVSVVSSTFSNVPNVVISLFDGMVSCSSAITCAKGANTGWLNKIANDK